MSALRATACGFSTLVVARLPLPQRLDCTGAASGGREHPEAPDLPEDVLALLAPDLLDLGGTYGDPTAGDPIQYDELRNRRPCGARMGAGFGAIIDWHIGPQRLRFPGHRCWRCGRESNRVTDTSACLLGHQNVHAVEFGEPLDARRDVHRIPDGRVFAAAR